MADLVSILTPAYRAESTIVEATLSVLYQTYGHWEMLIVADDELDYRQILREHQIDDPRIYFYRTPTPQLGPNVARNIGYQHAAGEWIAPLDADDSFYPRRLEILLTAAQYSGLALDNVKIVGEHLKTRVVLDKSLPRAFGFEEFKNSLVPLLFLFHRRHIHGGWDEDVARGADTLFNLRALESAKRADFIPEPLHEYRVVGQSLCHAVGAENVFHHAYRHTLQRLNDDGLGFKCPQFRAQVIDMIKQKQKINMAFDQAKKNGYIGNYQSFVEKENIQEY